MKPGENFVQDVIKRGFCGISHMIRRGPKIMKKLI
jgi:hypothetical protein